MAVERIKHVQATAQSQSPLREPVQSQPHEIMPYDTVLQKDIRKNANIFRQLLKVTSLNDFVAV